MRGILVDSASPVTEIEMGDYHIKAMIADRKPKVGGGLIIMTGPGEYYITGKGMDIFFLPKDSSMRSGIDIVDEGIFKDGTWFPERRLNGDETHASTYDGTGIRLLDQPAIQRVTLYNYK
jgi:hypothetical protein